MQCNALPLLADCNSSVDGQRYLVSRGPLPLLFYFYLRHHIIIIVVLGRVEVGWWAWSAG